MALPKAKIHKRNTEFENNVSSEFDNKFNLLIEKLPSNYLFSKKFITSIAGNREKPKMNFLDSLIIEPGLSQLITLMTASNIRLSNISSILSGAGIKAVPAFQALFKLLFKTTDSVTYQESPMLTILKENGINLSNISSILSGAGAKAASTFQDLFKLLFDKVTGQKILMLTVFEEYQISLTSIFTILSGTNIEACTILEDLFKLLFEPFAFIEQNQVYTENTQHGFILKLYNGQQLETLKSQLYQKYRFNIDNINELFKLLIKHSTRTLDANRVIEGFIEREEELERERDLTLLSPILSEGDVQYLYGNIQDITDIVSLCSFRTLGSDIG